ncbi:MAG: patatin-like phospholipase family protein [Gammaproteobacteria bacterium]|nr:patatin-like phospholipase family protein [Gammaproteobacteria bacterium]
MARKGILDKVGKPRTGLILSGGGSRAAYQVGVLRAVANILPKNQANPFAVISGTSAGALNAAALASHAWRFGTAVRSLEVIWKNLHSEQVYDPQSANLLGSASNALLSLLGSNRNEGKPVALFDNTPLRRLLSRVIRFERIQHNIDVGLLDAISVTASAYDTGQSYSFYQAMQGRKDWTGPHRIGMRTRLQLHHLMASSAIPLIFPAVQIGKQYFGDGAIRQLAPANTTLQLGAHRLLAIGVSGNRSGVSLEESMAEPPGLLQVFGHILNSAFVDHLENDLEFLRHMNAVLPLVPEQARQQTGRIIHEVEMLEISPSKAINKLALEHYEELPKPLSRYIKPEGSGTLLSLILYEKGFCRELMQLGFDDAMAKEAEIRLFFDDHTGS